MVLQFAIMNEVKMVYRTIKKRDGYKAKDFCKLWRRKYYQKYKKPFLINWYKDGARFRYLLSVYTPKNLKELVEFAFLECKDTTFLQSTGYSIAVFVSQINSFNSNMENKGSVLESDSSPPYYEDPKFALLVTAISDRDLRFLVQNFSISDFKSTWKELILRSEQANDIEFTRLARTCFLSWTKQEKFLRTRIRRT